MNVRDSRFPLVDSLRAIAALSVLAFHAAFFARVLGDDSALGDFMAQLQVGVPVFFLVSGFLLYRPFVRARLERQPPPDAAAYGWRRFLRIVPAYWVALTVVALWLGLSGVFTADGIPRYYGFAQIYSAGTAGGGISQAWTLCVEVTFYAFLPVWALVLRRVGDRGDRRSVMVRELAALGALALASVAYKVFALTQVMPTTLESRPWLMPLPAYLDQFALGMAMAVVSAYYAGDERLPGSLEAIRRRPWLPLAAAAVALVVVSVYIGSEVFEPGDFGGGKYMARHFLYGLIALGLLLTAVYAEPERGAVGRVLGNRVLAWFGLVSYGLYLYHYAVISKLEGWIAHDSFGGAGWAVLAYLALGLAGATVLAALSYYLVERPALRLKERVPARKPAAGQPVA